MYAKVIIEYSVKKLDKEFIYMIPEYLKDKLKIGMKVSVSFGNKEVIGFVTDIVSEIDTEDYEIKYITDIVDEKLVLNEELMTLGKYLKDRTLCSLITAYQTMLPSSLKVKKNTHNYDLYIEYLKLIDEDKANKYKFNNPRKKRQINLIEELLKNKTVNKKGIIKMVMIWNSEIYMMNLEILFLKQLKKVKNLKKVNFMLPLLLQLKIWMDVF